MKFIITREQFLKDLPEKVRTAIKQNVILIPKSFIFNGSSATDLKGAQTHKNHKEISKKHNKLAEVLSPTEFNIFCHLLESFNKKKGAESSELVKYTRNPNSYNRAGLIAQHVKNIRRKFEKHSVPFRINTRKWHMSSEPYYELEELIG